MDARSRKGGVVQESLSLVTGQRKLALTLAAAFLAVGFAWYVSARPMDFRVYYHGAEGVLNESRPVYGNYSGMGWPMHYRYPPIFLFFAMPFTLLPLPWASALWTFLKCVALFLLIRALWNRLGPTNKQGRMAHSSSPRGSLRR